MGETYKAEVIGVGTELLLGQIANTNAKWISEQLANVGISIFYHQVVGDNLERVISCFEQAANRSDLVFVTGGLGPTEDDLTREAFAKLSNKKLMMNEQVLSTIANYFSRNNRQMTANNRKQAMTFEHSIAIPNPIGTAPGMIVNHKNCMFIFMPGVPREMKKMMEGFVINYLKDQFSLQDVIRSRMLRFIGIGESQLEDKIQTLISNQDNPTIAPLATDGEVAIRLTAKAETAQQANQLIEQKEKELLDVVGNYLYGHDDITIEKAILMLLNEKNQTIAAAESLTGGLFADAMVSNPGASDVFLGSIVSYAMDAKKDVLDVSDTMLDRYGAVSHACAEEMAKKAANKFKSDIAISFTGVAGPNTSQGKEVGTVIISIYFRGAIAQTEEFHFSGDRNFIRRRSVKKGLELLYHLLKKNS
ncbi:Putative competence-damage inducible protein [Paraliobacillus sp. PM-2]|uniref:competence/damage-inducible protein A n=1 Tax=Paraliobacillus sp. PM-2 TaxID=1462524 RepID=UPI00061BF400|nr:competence/damage-inducible protein A [Paraliobacillus sp. PM-2]CQR47627.1 Putative competence-damage inducible protein [Paraliobacillus sp. PM-2]